MSVLVALIAVSLYSLVQHKVAPDQIFGMERYTRYWKAGVGGRLGGTYQCPNHIAHLIQMWIPLCLAFCFMPQLGWFWRICCAYAIPVFALLIYQTQSRAGMLGLIASLGTFGLLLILRKSRRLFYISFLVIPLLGAGAIGGLWAGSSMFRERMQPVVEVASKFLSGDVEEAIAVDFRPQTWADGMEMFKNRPVIGFGPGNYGLTFPEYRQRVFANRLLTVHPHNEYVELLTEYGLVGAILTCFVLMGLAVKLVPLIQNSERLYYVLPAAALLAALVGTAVHGMFDFELRIFPNALMLSLLAGCAVSPLLAQQESGVRSRESGTRGQRTGESVDCGTLDVERETASRCYKHILHSTFYGSQKIVFLVVTILSALWGVQVMGSALLRVHGDRLFAEQRDARAETFYKAATVIDPQNWQALLGLGQISSRARYYQLDPAIKKNLAEQERDVYAAAYRHNTKKEEIMYGLGRAELALSVQPGCTEQAAHREEGLDFLRKAAHYKRFNDYYWRKLGIELRKAGHYEEAYETFLYAQKLNRSHPTIRYNLKWLRKKLGVIESR